MNIELLRFLSLSVLPIIVLGIGYLILRNERNKRIDNIKDHDKSNC